MRLVLLHAERLLFQGGRAQEAVGSRLAHLRHAVLAAVEGATHAEHEVLLLLVFFADEAERRLRHATIPVIHLLR